MKLTKRILEAISQMSAVVEAGSPEDYLSYDDAETRKAYQDALDAGSWANSIMHKRYGSKERKL